jgi:hypothetical protein
MKYYKPFLSVLSIIFLLSSCDDKEIPAIDINEVPKKFFNIQNGSKLTYVNVNDTNKETDYYVANHYNTYVNPDISNNEVLYYELVSPTANASFLMRIESGGKSINAFNDRISMIYKSNDTFTVGALFFYTDAKFLPPVEAGDSVQLLDSRTIGNRTFQSVLRIKLRNNPIFNEVYFANGIGLVGYIRKNGSLVFLKKSTILR